jgi:protein-S-isoprenylcysteine O-methyltransferase Ste14
MQDRANVRILPPIVLGVALALGIAIGLHLPERLLPDSIAVPLGLGLVASSVSLVLAAAVELKRKRTAFDVRKPTSALVQTNVPAITLETDQSGQRTLALGRSWT